ncbi:hypothetical protein [Kitasatospora phosalacinea]|uniref:HEAT repeat domain-containing protein n=1 Tax=Kitasatospora phosalacinea TaxID=2065 RepID=A0A9W6PPQ4_9ACTN|nr:hypothetical protein [Kitasatospora phosalacinea]GLW58582.1 hypothetical protein Kpho01_65930 [Kitasatospora phosalacinea]
MTDTEDAAWSYSPPDTLLGALERGRGLGWAYALSDRPAGAEAVLDCLHRDTRWDRSVDQRADYQAYLVRELGLPIEPLLAQLDNPDENGSEWARETLARLALLGSAPAREALRRYVREGEWWQKALSVLADNWPTDWWEDLGPDAVRRLGGERPELWGFEPWLTWRELLPVREPAPRARRPVRSTPRTDRLLAVLTDPESSSRERGEALRTLAERPTVPVELLALVPDLSTDGGDGSGGRALGGVHRAVRRLGPLAVGPAREWADDDRHWLQWLGVQVLAEHGGTGDVPRLVAELASQWEERAWCGPKLVSDGLARLGPAAAEAGPLLRRFWQLTPHSYERPSYLRALHAIDPDAAAPLLSESLWDCEPDARLYAVRHVPVGGELEFRLAELRDSPVEDDELREAAAGRLG